MDSKYQVIFPANLKIPRREVSFDRFINIGDWLEFALLPNVVFIVVHKKYIITEEDKINNIELHVDVIQP